MKNYYCKIALLGIYLISFSMCERDTQLSNCTEDNSSKSLKSGFSSTFSRSTGKVESILKLPEYGEFVKTWVDLNLWVDKSVSKFNKQKRQSALLILDKVKGNFPVADSEIIELLGFESYNSFGRLVEEFDKAAKKLVKVLPVGLNLSDDEQYNLGELTYTTGLIPVEQFPPEISPDDTLPHVIPASGEESLQRCLDAARNAYNWCIAITIGVPLATIILEIGTGNFPSAIGLYCTSLGSALSFSSCDQNYFRDVDLCVALHTGGGGAE